MHTYFERSPSRRRARRRARARAERKWAARSGEVKTMFVDPKTLKQKPG